MAENDYNQIFERLVTSDNPVGLIAYSLYKKEKRKEIVKLKKKGKNLTARQIKAIESVLENQLDEFKKQANKLLDETYETLIEKNKDKIYCTYFKNNEFDSINNQINLIPTKKSFLKRLGESLLFRFIWISLIALISIIIYWNSEKLMEAGEKLSNMFNVESTTKESRE